jgi:hypothetical protein
MIFAMAYMFIFFGLFLAGMAGLLPADVFIMVPSFMRMILFFVGFVIALIGVILVQGRALKTGAIHLLEYGRPNKIIWFYVYKDGSIKITPSMREVEGQLYSPELDAQIHELKSYRLFDHSVRFVPEGTGHAIDLGMCLYATFLKNRWGFANLRQARKSFFNKFGVKSTKLKASKEKIMEFEE